MRHRPATAVPIDEPFVARRLAMAEGVLSQTLERLGDGSLSRASAAYATLEVERAAARVRYWRELQRREASHASVRACKLLVTAGWPPAPSRPRPAFAAGAEHSRFGSFADAHAPAFDHRAASAELER